MTSHIVGETRPCKRFEWERIVRRALLDDKHIGHLLPTPRRTTTAAAVKLVAFTLATYANQDGTKIHPGDEKIARVTGSSTRTVAAARTVLIHAGLLEMTRSGRGRTFASEYRLTVPVELLEHVPMLDPTDGDDPTACRVIEHGSPDDTSGHDRTTRPVTPHPNRTSRHAEPDESAPMTGRAVTNDRTSRPDTGTRPPHTSPSPSEDEAPGTTGSRARARASAREAAERARR